MPPLSSSKRPQRNRGPLSSDRILNGSSPVLQQDLHAFLILCISGWDVNYTEEERQSIIDTLPRAYRCYERDGDVGNLRCPLSLEFVCGDPFLKAAVTRLKQDVENGYYETGWQGKARRATQERKEGRFDAYLKTHAEELFGTGANLSRQEGSAISLQDKESSSDSDREWRNKATSATRKKKTKQSVGRESQAEQKCFAPPPSDLSDRDDELEEGGIDHVSKSTAQMHT